MMKVRPYALLGDSLMRRIEYRLDPVIAEWCAGWGLDTLPVHVNCERCWESQLPRDEEWQRCYRRDGQEAWLSWPSEFAKYIQRQIFPSDQRHAFPSGDSAPIATDGAQKAITTLVDAVANAFGLSTFAVNMDEACSPRAEFFAFASGAISVNLKIGEQSIKCLLDYSIVREQFAETDLNTKTPLQRVDLAKALSATPVSLTVSMGQVDVGVGNFMTLALGDVIRLPAAIAKPLTVMGPDSRVLFGAYLGKQSQSLAIEVVPYKT